MTVMYVKTMEEFQALLKTSEDNKLVVIDFTATWCGPCRRIAPIFEKMAKEHPDVKFAKVDVDEASDVSGSCGVSAMPTFQFYKSGSKVESFSGADETKLASFVEQLRHPGITRTRESGLEDFFDACLSGNVAEVQRCLEKDPSLVSQMAPQEWHAYHIMRDGWQPVESTQNPGVMNASKTVFLRANPPAYALHLAAGNGHTELVDVLLSMKADLEAGDGDGDTALAWATYGGRRDMMDQLLAAGADSSFAIALTRAQYEGVKGDGISLEYLKKKRNS